jgi:uncharacterized protein DUF541
MKLRSLTFALTLTCGAAALVAAGCHASNSPSYQPGPQAGLSMEITVDSNRREPFVTALRSTVAKALASGATAAVDVNDYGYPSNTSQTIVGGVDLYTSALDDARRKAEAIAQRLHVTLGHVVSATEQLQSYPIPGLQGLKGGASQSLIRVSPNQPVVLYVVFATTGAGAPDSIAIYGLSSSKTEVAASAQAPKTVNVHVQINGHGSDMQAATEAQSRVESAVRQEASAFGIPNSSIRLTSANFSQP